jgi:hypothetical protein
VPGFGDPTQHNRRKLIAANFQVTFDAANPARLAEFWAEALGYRIPDPPEGHETWEDWAQAQGIPEDQWDAASAAEDPEGKGPRLFFQRVPEGKTAKNRMHLDLNLGGGHAVPLEERKRRIAAEVERLKALGATDERGAKEEMGTYWVRMNDPEGNEFCVQ